MKTQGEQETGGQGGNETAPRARVAASLAPGRLFSRPLVTSSPRHLVSSRPSRAFTLPEVLASLVLIGLVLPAVMKGVSLAMAASDDARRRVEAVGLAETKLAEMSADVASNQASAGGSGDFGDEAPGYVWEATTANAGTSLTEVSVRVSWTARGAQRGVTLSTYAYAGSSTTTGAEGGAP